VIFNGERAGQNIALTKTFSGHFEPKFQLLLDEHAFHAQSN
jgi:hypothetical protein